MVGTTYMRGGGKRGSLTYTFFMSPPPLAIEGTRDLDNEERRDGRSGIDHGMGLTGCDGGIDNRLRQEGF
jgi:hypothetical protein